MCGVLAPEINYEKMEIFQGLMAVSVLRGSFGGGFAAVPTGNSPIEIRRNPELTAAELAYGSEFYGVFHNPKKPDKLKKMSCLLGHARFPTSGSYGVEAMHPHHSGNILGMHNGTFKVVNGKTIDTKKDNDSALFFEAVSKVGIDETIHKSDGAYSLVWINRSADTISFLRNEHRPMHFARVEGEDALFWASEQPMLQLVLNRKVAPKKVRYMNLNPGVVLTYRLHNIGKVDYLSYSRVGEKSEKTEIIPAGPTGPHLSQTKRPTPLEIEKIVVSAFPHGTRHQTLANSYVERDDLDKILLHGCDNCKEPAIYPDYDRKSIYFFSPKKFMCHHCLDYDQTAQEYFTSFGLSLPLGIKPISQSKH
jgi:hypothetical protein